MIDTTAVTFANFPMRIGTGALDASAGNHTHTTFALSGASSIGAAWSERVTIRTATGTTSNTDLVVQFTGTEASIETMPAGVARSNKSGRVLTYINNGTANWTIRQANTSNLVDGSNADIVLPPNWVLVVINTDVNRWAKKFL